MRLRPKVAFLLTAILLPSAHAIAAGGQDDPIDRIARIERTLQPPAQIVGREVTYALAERMAHHKVPGLSVSVFENGRIAWAKAWGVLEVGSTRPVDTHTLFQAASIGKPLTATLAMKTAARGLVGLDQPVNEVLREWKIPDNDFTRQRPVTLRQLLTHRAGILVGSFVGFEEGESLPSLEQILKGEPPADTPPIVVDMLPGSSERYTDFGYAVVQQLLTERLGAPFRESMRREVLDPAGMLDATFAQPLDAELRANAATGHTRSGEPIAGRYRVFPDLASSGLWATPSDICRWSIALIDAWRGSSERLLSRAAARQLLGEGLISVQELDDGALRFQHAGSNPGFTSVFWAYTSGCGAAVMANSSDMEIVNEVVRAIAVAYGWKELQPRTIAVVTLGDLGVYAGSYRIEDLVIRVRAEGDHLVAQNPREGTLTLYPESATDFVILEQGLPIKFEFDGGKVVRARNSRGFALERIE